MAHEFPPHIISRRQLTEFTCSRRVAKGFESFTIGALVARFEILNNNRRRHRSIEFFTRLQHDVQYIPFANLSMSKLQEKRLNERKLNGICTRRRSCLDARK